MSLRKLKSLIHEKESKVRQRSGNQSYKDLGLRRRFNRLAGGAGKCSWNADEVPERKRLDHYDEDSQKFYYCENDKALVPCVKVSGEGKGRACASTDASGACPLSCKPTMDE